MVNDKPVVLMEQYFKLILKIENNDPTKTQTAGVPPTDFNNNLFLIKHKGGKEVVCMKAIEGMLEKPDTMDNFKRAFVLLCLRYVICAPSNGKLGKKMLKYVEHTNYLKYQRWAELAMDTLVEGIRTYKDSKAGKKNLGVSMLYYYNKLTNKTPDNLIKEGIKSSLRFDDEIMSENEVLEIKMAIENYDAGDTLKNLIINNYKLLKMEKEIDEDMKEEEEEDINIDEDMGIYESVQESMLEHEDNKIDDEIEIDEGVKVMHKTVGPFRIHHNILKIGDCQLLETWFKIGDDSMTLVCVKDAERFVVSKGEFWKRLNHHCYVIVFDNEKRESQIWDTVKRDSVEKYETEIENLWISEEQRCLLAFRILTAAENTHEFSLK
ncbi:hypothetical protein Tco_1387189 [Tanacetum coccineum]